MNKWILVYDAGDPHHRSGGRDDGRRPGREWATAQTHLGVCVTRPPRVCGRVLNLRRDLMPMRLIYQLLELLDHMNPLLRLLDRNKKRRKERED